MTNERTHLLPTLTDGASDAYKNMKALQLRKFFTAHPVVSSILAWVLALAVAVTHTWIAHALPYQLMTYMIVYPLVILFPGAVTMILLPGAWRRWYRWVALGGLSLIVFPEMYPLVLLVAETWLLHQSWVTERRDGGPQKTAIRWPWKNKLTPPARKSGPTTVAEAIAAEKAGESKPAKAKKFPTRGSSRPVTEDGA